MKAIWLWPLWQAIVLSLAIGFTRRGKQRFVQWVTGLALNVEEHTITQSLIALGRPGDWKALESFAEYGPWHLRGLQWAAARRLSRLPNRAWHGFCVWAGDDTKVNAGRHRDRSTDRVDRGRAGGQQMQEVAALQPAHGGVAVQGQQGQGAVAEALALGQAGGGGGSKDRGYWSIARRSSSRVQPATTFSSANAPRFSRTIASRSAKRMRPRRIS
jgi:hypothetical protein